MFVFMNGNSLWPEYCLTLGHSSLKVYNFLTESTLQKLTLLIEIFGTVKLKKIINSWASVQVFDGNLSAKIYTFKYNF